MCLPCGMQLLLVQHGKDVNMLLLPSAGDNTFACTKSYSRKTGEFGEPPAELRAPPAADKGKGKGSAASSAPAVEAPAAGDECVPGMHGMYIGEQSTLLSRPPAACLMLLMRLVGTLDCCSEVATSVMRDSLRLPLRELHTLQAVYSATDLARHGARQGGRRGPGARDDGHFRGLRRPQRGPAPGGRGGEQVGD